MATTTAASPTSAEPRMNLFQEFRAFLDKYGVIGLAIAFVIGAALTAFVQAVVADLLMPLVGLLIPGGDWQGAAFVYPALPEGVALADAPKGTLILKWGHLLGAAINFVIIAAFVFLVAKFVLRQKQINKL